MVVFEGGHGTFAPPLDPPVVDTVVERSQIVMSCCSDLNERYYKDYVVAETRIVLWYLISYGGRFIFFQIWTSPVMFGNPRHWVLFNIYCHEAKLW